ncbi:hypothetical protein [Methylocucumis oryzae]|uniref:hypothetical protein n=1 Tax=Methylocucumis oryzae TaxID=1632867 RepID=UPI00103BDE9B|nr:hypothetical protein [Methylocucumis oryzae]
MPRWASRILLEITDVRVERLHDISEQDAEAEGVECIEVETGRMDANSCVETIGSYIASYAELWDKLNKGEHSWTANPLVWVIEFKVI